MIKNLDALVENVKPHLLPMKDNQKIKDQLINIIKIMFDKNLNNKKLQTQNMDIEQIWYQMNKMNNENIYQKFLQNDEILQKLNKKSKKNKKQKKIQEQSDFEEEDIQNSEDELEDENSEEQEFDDEIDEENEEEIDDEMDEENDEDMDQDMDEEIEESINDKNQKKRDNSRRPQKTEDQQLNDFLNYTDQIDNGKIQQNYDELYEDIDDEEIDEDEEEKQIGEQKMESDEDQSNEKQDESQENLEHDVFDEQRDLALKIQNKKKTKLNEQIDQLEEKLVAKKDWQVQGEVKSKSRPMNSLLEENLEFNQGAKVEQQITQEFTENLEKIIKQRCLDEAWDDRIKNQQASTIQENYNSLQDLNFEKSNVGLAGEYEDQFKTDVLGLSKSAPDEQLKKEIEYLYKTLSYTLDNLSNLSFAPKPFLEKVNITPNVPSIQLEEKIPLFISEKMQKAPQEIFNTKKDAKFIDKKEMDHDENQKAHRTQRKLNRSRIQEQKKKQLNKKLDYNGQTKFIHKQIQKANSTVNKQVDNKKEQSIKFTKSNQFFQNLQNKETVKVEKPKKKQNFKL